MTANRKARAARPDASAELQGGQQQQRAGDHGLDSMRQAWPPTSSTNAASQPAVDPRILAMVDDLGKLAADLYFEGKL